MYEHTSKTVRVRTEIEHPDYPAGDVLLVQPDEDLVETEDEEVEFEVGEQLTVLIPATDDTTWISTGEVLKIDTDDEPLLLAVKVNWGEATLYIQETA